MPAGEGSGEGRAASQTGEEDGRQGGREPSSTAGGVPDHATAVPHAPSAVAGRSQSLQTGGRAHGRGQGRKPGAEVRVEEGQRRSASMTAKGPQPRQREWARLEALRSRDLCLLSPCGRRDRCCCAGGAIRPTSRDGRRLRAGKPPAQFAGGPTRRPAASQQRQHRQISTTQQTPACVSVTLSRRQLAACSAVCRPR